MTELETEQYVATESKRQRRQQQQQQTQHKIKSSKWSTVYMYMKYMRSDRKKRHGDRGPVLLFEMYVMPYELFIWKVLFL